VIATAKVAFVDKLMDLINRERDRVVSNQSTDGIEFIKHMACIQVK